MKAAILLLTTSLALFSVPVFAVGIEDQADISAPVLVSSEKTIPTNNTNNLIHDLNIEFDRLSSKGYTHEDYDISDAMRNIIMDVVFPPGIENATQMEKDEWAKDRASLFESFHQYIDNLPDGERKIMFENASWYMHELIYAD
ncbi:MAG: hypothetical protein PHH70_05675 [Candidatus Gracilibacteria bacterium]|nr:hypothetical protein [Candidatus Gracilibacteria bacterium]